MPRYLILAQSDVTAGALGAWLELIGEAPLRLKDRDEDEDSRCIVWNEPTVGGEEKGVLAYEDLVRRIEIAAGVENGAIPLNQVVVLVDAIRPGDLNPLQEGCSWDGIVAMLILTFPEIRWVFGVAPPPVPIPDEKEKFPSTDHSLSSLLTHPRRDPLLDPTGLREWVRDKARDHDCDYLPKREHTAAAMDEEKAYAYFHGYTAYRFGYRSDVVSSWALAKHLFEPSKQEGTSSESPKAANGENSHRYRLLIEDMSLNFADRGAGIHLLQLASYLENVSAKQGRAHHLHKLDSASAQEDSQVRLLVTTGQGSARYSDALAENRRYLRDRKQRGRGQVIFKPAGGMFELWDEARLLKRSPSGRRKGDAEGFIWPPNKQPAQSEGETGSGHGAPGRMSLIADSLLRRAHAIQNTDTSVLEDIQGALLATDALELLGGRTPTLAAEALTQKHLLEVQAECHFSGAEFHFDMKPRLAELEIEAQAIADAFQRSEQENARLNILMRTENRLVKLLRDANQFDEEQFWMDKARHLYNTLWMREKPMRYALWPVIRYIEFLLGSFSRFVVVLALWILLFSWLYASAGHIGWSPGLQDAITSFFSIGGPIHQQDAMQGEFKIVPLYAWAICGASFLGFIHLGVFISHLYTVVSRK